MKKSIVEAFREAAQKWKDNKAVIFKNRFYSYEEVERITDAIAIKLIKMGIKKEDKIGIMIDRSELMVFYPLAVLKAGGAYMPLDFTFPEDRLMYMVKDGDVKIILSETNLVEKHMPEYKGELFCWDMKENQELESIDFPEIRADNAMVILYTSGSTGMPKGCILEHRNVVHYCDWFARYFELTEKDRIGAYANFGFDAHLIDLYPTLLSGGAVYIIPSEKRLDFTWICNYYEKEAITGAFMTTQLGIQFAELYKNKKGSLRYLGLGGEKLQPIKKPSYRFVNLYGPTEATINVTAADIVKDYDDGTVLGKVIDHCEIYILDEKLKPVEIGESGEICIGGAGVSRGYLNREEQTKTKFIEWHEKRLYRTGDIGKLTETGEVIYEGRGDSQVKLRGLRIELGEIESRLKQYEKVKGCAVAVKNLGESQVLCGYYLSVEEISTEELKKHLGRFLTAYMIPEVFIRVEEIPVTSNGKVNRDKLPLPFVIKSEIVLPENQLQEDILTCAKEVTGIKELGITDDLLQSGMSSLSAIRFSVMLFENYGISIETTDILKYKTVLQISELGKTKKTQEAWSLAEKRESYPLSDNQKGLMLYCLQYRDSTTYNLPFSLEFTKAVQGEKLVQGVKAVIDAHPYVKTKIIEKNGEFLQIRQDSQEAVVEYLTGTKEEAEKYRNQFLKPFEVLGSRLYKAVVFETEERIYFIFDFHHLIFDGGSLDIFIKEVGQAYLGKELLEEQVTAYDIAWAQKEENSQKQKESKAFFAQLLKGKEGLTLESREQVQGTKVSKVYSEVEGNRLRELAKTSGVTLSNIFSAAVMRTLVVFGKQKEIGILTVSSGRENQRLSRSLGMYVKTQPMVSLDAKGLSSIEYMKEIQEQAIAVREHGDYPFIKIVEELNFQSGIMYIFQGEIGEIDEIAGEVPKQFAFFGNQAMFPVLIQVHKKNMDYCIEIEYDGSLYNQDYIQKLAECIGNAVRNMAAQPEEAFEKCSILSEKEEAKIRDYSGGKKSPVPKEDHIVGMFRAATEKYKDHVAVVYKERKYTYKELDVITDALAKQLILSGVKKEETIGIMVDRSELVPIYILGVLKAGGCYMPLDMSFPKERLEYMLSDAKVGIVLTEGNLFNEHVPGYQGKILNNEILKEDKDLSSVKLPKITGNQKLVLLYTSGSTGTPKGCILEHHNLANYIRWDKEEYQRRPEDRVAAYANFGFDAHMIDLFATLLSGGACYIIPSEKRLDFNWICDYFEQEEITTAFMTTQLGVQFIQLFKNRSKALRLLIVGGEKLPAIKKPEYGFYNIYGPTETTINITAKKITEDYDDGKVLGRPIGNGDIFILDPYLMPVPEEIEGELCIGGRGVGRGYLNREDLNQEKFIQYCGRRIYKTGDIGKWTKDGLVSYIGRADGQVKLRGLRIELGEIEKCLGGMDGISQCAVVVKKMGTAEHLVAYYTGEKKETVNVKNELSRTLTSFMIPTILIHMEELPFTSNGKINKKILPEPTFVSAEEDIVHPETEIEKQIADGVSRLTGTKPVSVTEDLINVGLTSLLAINLSVILHDEYKINLDTGKILQLKTIRKLAKVAGIVREEMVFEKLDKYPLADNQKGMIVDCMKEALSTVYNIPYVLKFSGEIDGCKLAKAVKAAIDAHPYLKVTFFDDQGEVFQKRQDGEEARVNFLTLTEEAFIKEKEEFVKPFALFESSLYRVSVAKTPANVYLLMDFHHLIFDGVSLTLFLETLSQFYLGEEPETELYTAYEEIQRLRNEKEKASYEEAQKYFENLLNGREGTHLEAVSNPENTTLGTVSASIPVEEIEGYSRQYGVTESNIFAAGVLRVLQTFAGKKDVGILMASSGRNDVRLSKSVGMFVKTLPLVTPKDEGLSNLDYMHRIQKEAFESMERDSVSYVEISEKFHYQSGIMYVYEGNIGQVQRVCGEQPEQEVLLLNRAKFPISILIGKDEQGYVITIEYDGMLYNKKYIQEMAKAMASAVLFMISHKEVLFKKVEILPEEDKEKLLQIAKGRTLIYDRESTILTLLKVHESRLSSQTAIVDRKSSISYQALKYQTDKLARILRDQGIQKNQFVGILLPRMKEFPIAFLGIMKAGGAYVPIDPDYPADRKLYMLMDSGADILITDSRLYANQEDQMKAYSGKIIYMDKLEDTRVTNSVLPNITPDDIAYMIYTSGSTGKPKGVVISHRAMRAMTVWREKDYGLTNQSRIAVTASFSFDASVYDMIPAIACGGTLYVIDEEMRMNLPGMYDYFVQEKITDATFSTQLGMALLNAYELPLETITLGGEKLLPCKKQRVRIFNGYGPTEFTVCSDYYWVDQERDTNDIPIGSPTPNSWSYVMDENLNLVPLGMKGELCISGPQISEGYYHRPELTDEKFLINPYMTSSDNQRLYRTGDLVYLNEKGLLQFAGRIDDQIKLRGFRIELGEIENQISSFSGMTGAIALVKKINNAEHLCAYFTATEDVCIGDLRKYLETNLTEYMVPSALKQVDVFPMTPGGKIDKKLLPDPVIEGFEYIAPRTGTEKILCDIYGGVLGIENVGIKDNFFDIGGTSLLAMKIIAKVDGEGLPLVYSDIFTYKTPEKLGEYLESGGDKKEKSYEIADYDYTGINELISKNAIHNFEEMEEISITPIGDMLLTGATGYLGIHILGIMLKMSDFTVYCLVRETPGISIEERFKKLWNIYFSNGSAFDNVIGGKKLPEDISEWIGTRIRFVKGDLDDVATMKLNVQAVINAAALVKHFSAGDELMKINVRGVENLIKFCEENNSRLIQISTISISGMEKTEEVTKKKVFSESNLYVGQIIDNEYVYSKFLAERAVLEAILEKRIRGKIMRVGNLMPRYVDGHFQINIANNSFMNAIGAYAYLGEFPITEVNVPVELSPIGMTAVFILNLMRTKDTYTIFHVYNNHKIYMGDIIDELRIINPKLRYVDPSSFSKNVQKKISLEPENEKLNALMAYDKKNNNTVPIEATEDFTVNMYFRTVDFRWPMVEKSYFQKQFKWLESQGFFKK